VQAADIIWRQDEKRLVGGMNRLDWEQTLSGETASRPLVAAVRFERVLACKSSNNDLARPDATLGGQAAHRTAGQRGRHASLTPRQHRTGAVGSGPEASGCLVAPPVFKTGERRAASLAGSIPVRLR